MPKYVIEREIPGAGDFTGEDLRKIAQTSCAVLEQLGTDIQWIHSYVVDHKIICIYRSANKDLITRHADQGGFPANSISEVRAIIDPVTSE